MAVKKVEGVLVFNNKTRDEMLKRNIGKYSQWKYGLNPAIGEYYDIDYNRELKDLKDGKSLEDFTHDGKSEYSDDINRKYFSSGNKEKDVYTARDLTPGEYNPWPAFQGGNYLSYIEHGGKTLNDFTHDGKTEYSETIKKKYFQFGEGEDYSYRPLNYSELNPWTAFQQGTYIQYIDEVFGKDEVMTHVDYVNNLLSGQFIENALRQTEVGVIKDINVAAAMQGIVTTNPNNMSGEDTTLGKIGNSMYARTLYNGAIFNSDRIRAEIRDGENYYTKAYLTPYLVNQYGNNLANVMELSDIMKIGPNETQIREDLGKDVKILDGYDGNTANLNSPQFRILNEQIKRAINLRGVDKNTLSNTSGILPINIYRPVKEKGYVNLSKDKNAWRYDINWNDVDNFGVEDRSDDIKNNTTNERIISGIDNPISGRFSGPYFYNEYNEQENGEIPDMQANFKEPDEFNFYKEIPENKNTLLAKTSRLFHENQLDTLVARFHTDESKYGFPEFTDTARSKFGNSHGRNLLRLDAVNNPKNDTNGYDNPYCRTWTYHHQYNQIKKLIRPFIDDEDKPYKMSDIQAINKRYRANRKDQNGNFISGSASLEKNGVLQDNGFVRISPHRTEGDEKTDSIKNCMFSIENLAWKDVNVYKNEDNISREQVGPNGGRIMWFPPYNLDFQEGVNVEWNQNTFIGRGEKVYTYTNTERTGTLSFSLLIDHPAVINSMTYGYNGMGQEKDPEADILRFFAGCNLPEISDEPETGSTITTGQTIPNPSTKTGEIKFKIYFPNNFSGLVNRKKDSKEPARYDSFKGFVQTDDNSETTGGFTPEDAQDYWWQYLLVGNNTCIPSNPELFRGYEMSKESNKGLYSGRNFMDIPLPPCKAKQYLICTDPQENQDNRLTYKDKDGKTQALPLLYSCSNGLDFDNKSKYIYYQVDYDLRQILNDESLKDKTCFGLNARKEERQENEYTFAEVMLALLHSSNSPKYKETLYNKYFNYLTETCGVDKNKIANLEKIFGNGNTKYTEFNFDGCADTNDIDNSNMLGLRRSIVTKQMFDNILGATKDLENKTLKNENVTEKQPEKPASSIEMKQSRYCGVTLKYEIAESEKLSDTANNRGASEEKQTTSGGTSGETTEVTFEDYLDILVRNSDFVQVACNSDGYSEVFKRNLQNFFNKKEDKEYIRTLEENYDRLYEEIQVVLNNYIDLNAIALSNFISNSLNNCDSDFKTTVTPDVYQANPPYWFYNLKIKNLWNIIIPDDTHLEETYKYFFAIKPDASYYSQHFETYDTGTTMDKFPLREINYDRNGEPRGIGDDAEKYKSLDFSATKLYIDHLICLILLNYTNNIPYFYEFAQVLKSTGVYNTVYDLIRGFIGEGTHYSDDEIEKIYYDITINIMQKVEPELKKIIREKESAEAAENAQQIEQNRKDTEENKAVKQEEKAEQEARVARANVSKPQRNMRYETEAEYFTKLKVEDPVLFRNLQQKFKYFNPAFHSISPEGFNARLTFLHQCTRQGQTYEMSKLNNSANGYTKTASNLAFGRMPVCVIRIGDFINTRAIINSMSISYASSNGIIWDLNQEGAGVQPMYANVSLGITLLGGQSLGAPISRLQNAISFNYYANAEVYDNRADVAEYETVDGKTGVSYKRIWTPVMENTPEDTTQNANNNTVTTQAESNTDTRKSEVKDNSSFKNLTNEEAADKFAEDPVESQEMSEYVNEDSMVQFVISNYFEPFDITIYCNINYKKENYDARFYKYYRPVYNSVTKKGKDVDFNKAKERLEDAINVAIDNFIDEHTL